MIYARKGSKGENVRKIQQKLGIQVDGVFGSRTEQAVKDFQRRKGLGVDGVVGTATWNALFGGGTSSVGTSNEKGLNSSRAMDTVVNNPMQIVIGGALLYGLYKVFMRIF